MLPPKVWLFICNVGMFMALKLYFCLISPYNLLHSISVSHLRLMNSYYYVIITVIPESTRPILLYRNVITPYYGHTVTFHNKRNYILAQSFIIPAHNYSGLIFHAFVPFVPYNVYLHNGAQVFCWSPRMTVMWSIFPGIFSSFWHNISLLCERTMNRVLHLRWPCL